MEGMKTFLDSSTIHGLSYISSTGRWSRYFWIFVVIGGFSGAGYLIYESFYNWHQSPISTTIETLPISKITFPNVTVCPPKTLFLNLNYDIAESETKKLDKDKRDNIIQTSSVLIQEYFYEEMMMNLSKVEDPDQYYNWYHGYSKVQYPYHSNKLNYYVDTSALSGNLSTKYFEQKFEAEKVDANIQIWIEFNVPDSANETTVILEIEKRTIKEVNENDQMIFDCYNCVIDADLTYWSKNITNPSSVHYIKLIRKVSQDDIRNTNLDKMPGFRLSWKYDKGLYFNINITF